MLLLYKKTLYVLLALFLLVGIDNEPGSAQAHKDLKYEVEKRQLVVKYTREGNWLKEIQCLARNIHYEARGESRRGQLAVAKVTLNRVESDLFPNSICGVVNEGKHNAKGYMSASSVGDANPGLIQNAHSTMIIQVIR